MSEDEKKNACPTEKFHEAMGKTILDDIIDVGQGPYGELVINCSQRL